MSVQARRSPGKSFLTLIGATLGAGILAATALAPAAGVGGFAVAETNATMQQGLEDMSAGHAPGVTTITDRTGEPMAWIYKQRRYVVPADAIAQSMKDAIVSIEDRRFYEHDGVDIQGTARAMAANLLSGGVEQGASTLNQQYVKNYLLFVTADSEEEQAAATEQSVPRKLREMRMASDLDALLPKDEILARYLNLVPFGNGAYGIEAAAQTYFGITAAELSVPQSAMLAGMVQASAYLNPYTNPDGVFERRSMVLDAMVSTGTLSPEDAEAYKQEPLGVLEQPGGLPNGCITAGDKGFMCDYALRYLESKGLSQDEILNGSYTITTTLDPATQQAAHTAATNHVNPNTPGVAGVVNVVKPGADSREIMAMTSSRNYGLNLEAGETVLPQPTSMVGNGAGSVFKIFTAGVALEEGMGLDTVLPVPARYEARGMGDGGAKNCPPGVYCVENAGVYKSQMTLQEALAHSPNTTFVQLIEKVGVAPVVDLAVGLGLRSYAEPGSFNGEASIADYMKDHNLGSFTLGPTAVNALELSNVGASIASGGRWCEPNPILEVLDENGKEVFIDRPDCEDVMDEGAAAALMAGMSQDTKVGTAADSAKSSGWTDPVAAKTGTTESNQSSAFLGFNTGVAAAPYIYNDGTSTTPLCTGPVRQCQNGSLYGGLEPARMWFDMGNATPAARDGELLPLDNRYRAGTAQSLLDGLRTYPEEEARKRLTEEGYKVTTRTVPGMGIVRGDVVRAVPEGGTLKKGGTVILEISDGTRPAPTTRPTPAPGNDQATPELPNISREDLENLTNEFLRELGL
ncbi:penicillin-binding protein 1B [Corynebacterium renale]|uniref:Membrane peptidoglycan carboxypeptidase n=1 Tax=Corynebacterium renale TaxID=1724 RepID=A0A2A9DNC5_9CORY|nr:transglycosylase domain-containing protein [Corynebacterium renale]PFG27462.1 membrane peptidoglycan carboxypeptidase [Corynebacterium renale]SQG63846.1 penicillin-binding protein 1B [Corynebacterium renale]SQI23310.1 penicillin-binding protein 1B [Corynebacterium renale]STD02393.1 penicillin-binding protein 1B [Corynebacterium renale]